MATLPPDPYAPDPIREPDGTPMPNNQPESLPGPDNPEPPVIEPGDPSDTPTQTRRKLRNAPAATCDRSASGPMHLLNERVLDGTIDDVVVIAAPRTLGELRKHYHKSRQAKLAGEIAKDLTGQNTTGIEKAIASA